MTAVTPVAYLREISLLAQANRVALPGENAKEGFWVGIGFHINGAPLLVELQQIVEILDPIDGVRVPNVKPWFKGLANVRGNLLPIVDLNYFLFGKPCRVSQQTRIIVFADEGTNLGCIVDSVTGMRHFHAAMRSKAEQALPKEFAPYVDFGFRGNDEHWSVFEFEKLIAANEFLNIAAA